MKGVAWRRWRTQVKATSYDSNIPLEGLVSIHPIPHGLATEVWERLCEHWKVTELGFETIIKDDDVGSDVRPICVAGKLSGHDAGHAWLRAHQLGVHAIQCDGDPGGSMGRPQVDGDAGFRGAGQGHEAQLCTVQHCHRGEQFDQAVSEGSPSVQGSHVLLLLARAPCDEVLEGDLERVPIAAWNETLVMNPCGMYELAYVNHRNVKKTLSNWIAQVNKALE
ncbi:hypothetical protein ZIOFF_038958 [Zingiber officinale]|uniref:Uncharacterized protein n=1 Tax=Zingiber officinale TaxID=94328 RepID=A0A8J5G405_ZINOF|nr:hypothetical protein ZIOFF_038958 [Zingiber officinale]